MIKKVDKNNAKIVNIESLLDEILSYPIERKNLIENLEFLAHIKNVVITIRK